jgi:hypothetical protein
MVLEDSLTAQVTEQAKEVAENAKRRARRFAEVRSASEECVSAALEKARDVRSAIRSSRNRLEPVSSSIVSQVQSRVDSLYKQLKQEAASAAENTETTFSDASRRLAEESLAAGLGTSTGEIGELANQKIDRAVSEGLDRTFGEGTARAVRRKGKRARKAAVAALDIVSSSKSAFFRGVMGLLVRRTERDLRRMRNRLLRFRSRVRSIRRGAAAARRARSALSGAGGPRIEEAARRTETAHRNLEVARSQYEESSSVNEPALEAAGTDLSDASRLLASSRATALLRSAISGAGRSRNALQEARDAISSLGASPIASLYGQVLTWSSLARTMSDTAGPVYGVAQLVKAGQQIRYIEGETERLQSEIEALRPEEAERRAEIASELQELARKLGLLSQIGDDRPISEEKWYSRAVSFFNRPFFRGQSGQSPIQRLEVFGRLADQATGLVGLEPKTEDPVQAASTTLQETESALQEAQALSGLYEQSSSTVSVVAELLGSAGIENPIESILRGQFSREIKTVFAGATSLLPVQQADTCPEPTGTLPADKERAYLEAKRKTRERARLARGAITAISESNDADAQKMAELPS